MIFKSKAKKSEIEAIEMADRVIDIRNWRLLTSKNLAVQWTLIILEFTYT